jgi:hypothetical protein
VDQTHGDGDGFLWDYQNAYALTMGMWKPRACRWCSTPLEPEGTLESAWLLCPFCDDEDFGAFLDGYDLDHFDEDEF